MRELLPNVCSAGRRDNSNHWAGLRLSLQEVPGVWRQRCGNAETNWKSSKKSVFFFDSYLSLPWKQSFMQSWFLLLVIHFPVLTEIKVININDAAC